MIVWDTWKKGFELWEQSTAKFLEACLSSPLVLEPAGACLTAVMKAKKTQDDLVEKLVHGIGLPSRRDQERLLHAINQLTSKVTDLEDQAEERAPRG